MQRCITQFGKTPDASDLAGAAVEKAYLHNTTFDNFGYLQGNAPQTLPMWPPSSTGDLRPINDRANTSSNPIDSLGDPNEYVNFLQPRDMFIFEQTEPVERADGSLLPVGPPLDVEAAHTRNKALSMHQEEQEEEEQEEEEEEAEECSVKKVNKPKKRSNFWLLLFLFALSILALVLIVQFFLYMFQN
jgi:hypothetical protein